jgi:Integrase core domain
MEDWSPKQISGWLKTQYPNDQSLRVSHETIYRSLFIQARGALKQELVKHLRSQRRIRRSRHASIHGHSQGRIVDAISIRERPAEVEDRAVPGHWEGDLLRGAGNIHVVTLVERGSRFCMLVKTPGKESSTVVAVLSQHVGQLPAELRRSLTWDRGLEMAQHKSFTMATDVQVYFCDPQSPWQRGSNENTNGLLRQYLPKNADLSRFSRNRSWMRSLCDSIPGHDKPSDFELRRINCKPVLRRPLETTRIIGKWGTSSPRDGFLFGTNPHIRTQGNPIPIKTRASMVLDPGRSLLYQTLPALNGTVELQSQGCLQEILLDRMEGNRVRFAI